MTEETTNSNTETTTAETQTGTIAPPESLVGNPPAQTTEASAKTATEGDTPPSDGVESRQAAQPARAPETYTDFTLAEGVTLEKEVMAGFKSFAKEQDLTQDQAQKVLEFGAKEFRERLEAPYKEWSNQQKTWQAEVKADPDIGGTKYEQSIKDAANVFVPGESNPFVSSAAEATALRQALNYTGAGNNPAVVRLFVKMGRLLAEPGPLTGAPPKDRGQAVLDTMYDHPDSQPKGASSS